MKAFARVLFVTVAASIPLALSPHASAQGAPPGPAPELQKLAPLIGNWHGTGNATFGPGAPKTKWEARGTFRWCLDGHFVQEDFEIAFEGLAAPMIFRSYMGWDRENQRYVSAMSNSAGEVRLHQMTMLPDGTMLQMMMQSQQGVPYAERSLLKVEGDKLIHSIELLMLAGPSTSVVNGSFERGGKGFDGAFDSKTFEGRKADESIVRLGRSAGTYAVLGEMTMAPGMPPMKIHGTDTARTLWEGTVLHIHTDGGAEGMPGEYHADVLWGYDEPRRCIVGVFVSNMGEVGAMDAHWSSDGRLISTSSANYMGEPMVQRMIMDFDAKGATTKVIAHSILGTADPMVGFKASYTKK